MINIKTRILAAIIVPMLIMLGFCNSISKAPRETLIEGVVGVMTYQHFKPIAVDDTFSDRVYTLFLNQLDERKLFFTAKDLEKLDLYRYGIDDEVKARKYASVDEIIAIYKERIAQAETYSKNALDNGVNLDQNKAFNLPDESREACSSAKSLKGYWKDYSTFLVLDNYVRKVLNQEQAKKTQGDSFEPIAEDSLKRKAITEVAKNQKEWFKRLKRMKDKEYFDMFVNCIAMAYDPHSNYYPPRQKEDFDIRLSGQFEGIGATLTEREGYIKVENIVPGSASYRQGELKAGDLITEVAQNKAEAVSVVDMALSDVVQLIRGKKGTIVNLTVKKPDGTTKVIPIERDVVVIEEGYAKSALISSDYGDVGFISLPSFYADFNRNGGRSCAKDMAAEIVKLKKDKVKGVIIDLRYNGGGSLSDVVEMVGLFTGKGPAVQIKSKRNSPDVYNAQSSKPLYDGPLVILVNYYSASASEILAAALQDYKRAVIIGTKHTFGKGTVQRFMDLSSIFKSNEAEGSVKLTTQKFYRVNGKTTQFTGVVPDIIIPDRFDFSKLGERQLPYALKEDQLDPVIPAKEYSDLMINAIENGKQSVAKNAFLQKQKTLAENINTRNEKQSYTLKVSDYSNYLNSLKKEQEQLDSIKPGKELTLALLSEDTKLLSSDTIKLQIRKDWVDKLKTDAYLDESLKIINDLQ